MAFREVRVFEVREVLRLWLAGEGIRASERLVGFDRKTVRRYVDAAVGFLATHGRLLDRRRLDSVLGRLRAANMGFGTSSRHQNGEVYDKDGIRGFFFADPNGHGLEILTKS